MSKVYDFRRLRKLKKFLVTGLFVVLAAYIAWLCFGYLYPLGNIGEIRKYSREFGLDSKLVCAMIHSESRFDAGAVSSKGARGLMQIVKMTADWAAEELNIADYSYEKIHDPDINLRIGCWYISRLINQYGNVDTALAAYNAGSGNVSNWLKNEKYSPDGIVLSEIPFGETKRYVERVRGSMSVYSFLLDVFGGTDEK